MAFFQQLRQLQGQIDEYLQRVELLHSPSPASNETTRHGGGIVCLMPVYSSPPVHLLQHEALFSAVSQFHSPSHTVSSLRVFVFAQGLLTRVLTSLVSGHF
jgi:hypothetical protein